MDGGRPGHPPAHGPCSAALEWFEVARVTPTVAFVTVCYGKDRDRCALLCRSMREFAPSTDHWIVVDRADLGLFKSLQDARTTLLTTEEVLPVWLRRGISVAFISARTCGFRRVAGRFAAGSFSS